MRSGILFGFCAAFFILIVNGVAAYHGARALADSNRQVNDAHAVRTQLGLHLTDLGDAETALRDYVFLGAQEKQHSEFLAAIDRMESRLERLRDLIQGDPEQQQRLEELAAATSRTIPVLSHTMDLRQTEGLEAAHDHLLTGEGRALANVAREREADMLQTVDTLLQQRLTVSRDDAGGVAFLFLIMTGLALTPLVAVLFLYRRELRDRSRADERFRLAVESAPNAMVMVDAHGSIVLVNSTAEQLFGYSRDELLGQAVEILLPERIRGEHRGFRERFFAKPESRAMGGGRELFGLRKDGAEFPVEIGLNPIETRDGLFVLSAIVDITERQRTAQVLRHAHEDLERRVVERTAELEASNQELEAFSYSVSHDLRAPLRAIDGFSRILLKEHAGELSNDARLHLQTVRDNTLQMGHLVDDLLAFSRLSRQPVRRQPVSSESIVRLCLNELEPEERGRKIELRVGELPPCQADPALLKQVWTNLLSNAFKYTRRQDAAVIEIGSRINGTPESHVYFVRDNGVGFDMRYAHKLFGVFQRLHRAEDYEGTGVGLAIVQRIVHRHGGTVWAEASAGHGAAFYFTLDDGAASNG